MPLDAPDAQVLRKLLKRFEAGGRRNLQLLLKIKRMLSAAAPVDDAFQIFREQGVQPRAGRLARRPISSLIEAAAASPTYVELAPAGEAFTIEPPRVIGEGNHRPLSGTSRTLYLSRLDDVLIRGRSGIVVTGGQALLDFENDEDSRSDDQIDFDPAVFATIGSEALIVMPDDEEPPRVISEAFWLCGVHSIAFGHWLLEYLPKLAAARAGGRLPDRLPILIDAGMPPSHRRSLELLCGSDTPIIELAPLDVVRVERLWLAPSLMYMPLQPILNERARPDYICAPPQRFAAIARDMAAQADRTIGDAEGPQRVFMARRPDHHRRMVNAEAIEAIAQAAGFAIVYAEDLDFAEQVRLVRGARFLVGPEGSAMSLALFARLGTRQCLLTHPYIIGMPASTGFQQALGIDTTIMTGPVAQAHDAYPHMADFSIDTEAFAGFLDGWLESAATP